MSVKEPPSQILPAAGDIVPIGIGSNVTRAVFEAEPLQSPWWIVALYVPGCVAVIVASVSLSSTPFRNQEYDVPPVAVRTREPPAQIEATEGEIDPSGEASTVISEVFDAGPLQSPWWMVTL